MQRLLHQRGQALRDRIEQLARDPGLAHEAWKRLHPDDRTAVLHRMSQLFGDAFADQFLAIATSGKAQRDVIYWPAGTGPTDEQLRSLGYRRGGREITGSGWIEVEVWVHPNGKVLRRGSRNSRSAPRQARVSRRSDGRAGARARMDGADAGDERPGRR